jgi:uncharacterized membrane protein
MKTNRLHAALWASAIALGALIVFQAGGLTGNVAMAEMVSHAGEFTLLTTDSGTEEVLVVLDNRSEQLMVYHIRAQKTLEMMQNVSVAKMFESARLAAEGK